MNIHYHFEIEAKHKRQDSVLVYKGVDRFLLQTENFLSSQKITITVSLLLSLEKKIDRANGTGKMHFDQI